eukprot:scaffold2381_cov128-Cylindrotheca_fusiformis.AAC.16
MEGNSKYNEVVVGTDGAIYCMVKPPIYDVDTRTVEQSDVLARAPLPSHSSARVRNVVATNSGIRSFPESILPASLNTGNIGAFQQNVAFPSVGDVATLQPQVGFVPEMSLSSIGGFNAAASGNARFIFSAIGDTSTPTSPNQQNYACPMMPGSVPDGLFSRNRRSIDDLDVSYTSDFPNKRLRMTPLAPGCEFSTKDTVDPMLGCRSFSLYNSSDEYNISRYQCLARKQIEVFESTQQDASSNAQGRNRPITPGQVGIRCRHCKKLPQKQRKTGSVYYPNRLDGVYQTAQKLTVGHLCKHCASIPDELRQKLIFLKDQKSSDGGGKRYWADAVRLLGVIETPKDGLVFSATPPAKKELKWALLKHRPIPEDALAENMSRSDWVLLLDEKLSKNL